MSDFVYYELDDKSLTPALRKRLFAIPELRLRPDHEAKGWLVRSPTTVPRFEDHRLVQEERWARASAAPKPRPGARAASPSLIACPWKILPGERKAQLSRQRLTPKRSVLQLTFGEGRGDAVSIEVETTLPNAMTHLHVELRVPSDVALSLEPSLLSRRGRSVSVLQAQRTSGAGSASFDWALPKLSAEERGRIEKLSLTLSTEADSASVFVDAISFSA